MKKKDDKVRNITFYSTKNKRIVTVHSEMAKRFAECLEKDEKVLSYETDVTLSNLSLTINTNGFRKSMIKGEWVSDFMVLEQNQLPKIIEIVSEEQLEKKRVCSERLELSRRYWSVAGISGWKVVIMKKGETAW